MRQHRKSGAALVIVLAFVVLLLALSLAYFSRTVTDRQVAQSSFRQTNADQLALSAIDVIVADLNQEIVNGSPNPSTVSNVTIYTPSPTPNMLPMRSGTPNPTPTPGSSDPSFPVNLIRRSVRDNGPTGTNPMPSPGVPSRASAVNSTSNVSLNGRSISLARWNKHYLLPRYNTGINIDSTPPSPLPSPPLGPNPNPPVAKGFTPPDWVFVTSAGPTPSPSPAAVIGRYAYAIYDEGGLLDLNEAGYPADTSSGGPKGLTPAQIGAKGALALADLTQLPTAGFGTLNQGQVNNLVGWRNPATAQLSGSNGSYNNYTFDATTATNWLKNFVNNNGTGFLNVSTMTVGTGTQARTDQALLSRQELLTLTLPGSSGSLGFSQNVLQYLGTFSRELNRPTWKPSTPSGSTIDYATLAKTPTPETSTAINRDLTAVRDSSGNQLITRFPLSRLAWITYNGPSASRTMPPASPPLPATDPNYDMWQLLYTYGIPQSYLLQGTSANIKASFGLVWDLRTPVTSTVGQQWVYTSPSSANSGGTFSGSNSGNGATVIKTLSTVQSEARQPDFFEILKAVILNGSVGLGSNNTANTFVVADGKYYDTTNGKSADYQIMQIGANIIDEWDNNNLPTFLAYSTNSGASGFAQQLAGIENLPYLNKLVFKPYWKTDVTPNRWDAWLVPSLWNPNQNAPLTSGTVRIAMPIGTLTGFVTSSSTTVPSTPITGGPTIFMGVSASSFGTTPSGPTAVLGTPPSSITTTTDPSPGPYYGFHFTFPSSSVTSANVSTAYPDFGSAPGCDFEMQVQVSTSPVVWRAYQRWKSCGPGHPRVCQSPPSWTVNTLQDPEFVTLDPRTLRFGAWGNDGSHSGSGSATDYTSGVLTTLDRSSGGLELITALAPQGAKFTVSSFPADLSLYSTNGTSSNHYVDLDGVQRRGDWTTDPTGTSSTKTIMYASATTTPPGGNYIDRPQVLNRPFQSVAELGQVFRDQPWKTLNFTTADSGDVGLLDAFTLQDVSITAGNTSLNTRQTPVLTAILSQTALRLDGSSILNSTQVTNLVTDIASITAANPLTSKSQLIAQLATKTSFTGLGNKEARECVVRALSDAGQTRTWNLLIDVIAQSGRYPPTATAAADLATKFIVEGEQRYWVHVAIDRFTGQVIDKQVEAVNQ